MRRITRFLVAGLTLLSLLAGAGTVAMWVRSFQADVHLFSFIGQPRQGGTAR